jgi:hypothetical protein
MRVHVVREVGHAWRAIDRHLEPICAQDGTVLEPPCAVPLKPKERLVLMLIHLDPRLTHLNHRCRLRLLVHLVDPGVSEIKVGHAIFQLREHHERGRLKTTAFDRSTFDDPSIMDCVRVLGSLARMGQWATDHDADYRVVRALCLLGHVMRRTDPLVQAALADPLQV